MNSYKVSIEQIEALEKSIFAAEQEIEDKKEEENDLQDELDRFSALKLKDETQKKL